MFSNNILSKSKRFTALFMCIIMILSLSGCLVSVENTGKQGQYSLESFDDFTNSFFASEISSNYINLNYTLAHPENFGIDSYNVSYGSTDISALDDDSETISAIKALKSFKYDSLSDSQKLTYDILLDYLETYLEYSDLYLYDKTLSPVIGINCQLPVILAECSFRKKQDVYDYIELINTTDSYFAFLLKLEKMKSEKGLFMMDEVADMIIEQCDNFIENPDENYLIDIFNDKIDAMSDFTSEEKNQLKADNRDAVLNHIIPAYALLSDGLKTLKGTGQYEGGLCNYPDGSKYYEYLVYDATGSDRSIDEIEELIDKYLRQSFATMGTLLREDNNILDKAYDFSFGFDDPYAILDDLKDRINSEFPELPEVSYTIKYVHPSLEEHMSPAFYMIPAIDDYTSNSIYVNNKSVEEGQELYTTLAHEGFPGHLYQNVYTNSKGIAPVRSLLNYSGYIEGWATYVEMLSYNMGAVDDSLGSLMAANNLITLSVYAMCDIGVNYHGWDISGVEKCVSTYFGDLDNDVYEEIYYSMVSEPSNYLSYVIGCMEFMELRQEAQNTLGDKFDPVSFHDFILTTGPAPFKIIRDRMRERF